MCCMEITFTHLFSLPYFLGYCDDPISAIFLLSSSFLCDIILSISIYSSYPFTPLTILNLLPTFCLLRSSDT